MARAAATAVLCAAILGGVAVAAARRCAPDLPPVAGEPVRGEPAPLPGNEAVLDIRPAGRSGEVCVVRACGRVDTLSLAGGHLLRSFESGAQAWAMRFGAGSGESFVLAGIPVAVRGGRVVAVRGESIVESDAEGGVRVLGAAGWLRGARQVAHAGPGSAVFVGLSDGRIARVEPAAAPVFSVAVPGPLTVLRLAGPAGPVFGGGVDRFWVLLRGRDLEPLRMVPLRGEGPPVTAMAVSAGGRAIVVAYGGGSPRIDAFTLDGRGLRPSGTEFGAEARGVLGLAIHPDRDVLALGRLRGGVGYSVAGKGFHGGEAPGVPLRAVAFLDGGKTVVWGWDDGSVAANSYPGEAPLWGSPPERPGK